MGAALFWVGPMVDPYLTGSLVRRVGGLAALVSAGAVVYAIACLVTRAFVLEDIKLLTRRAQKA